jgi:DNA-binding transcriptional LysR family regulator
MELRHLRCFLAVAEELHFARAAERLHIDQSPLSRTIKELEEELGAHLFVRTTRRTQLTRAGRLFLEHVPRVFTALEQARDSVKSVTNGFHGQLRIALSDGITPSRLPALLAQCREEDPEVEIRLFEVPLAQQIKGLHDDLYDAGFSMAEDAGDGIVVTLAWEDELMVAVPARHRACQKFCVRAG